MSNIRNSEILFIYEAKLCNPNGDPDDENKPRIDPMTRRNLVSDVRLKRFFRNYIINNYGEDFIWVSKQDGKHVDATGRYDHFKNNVDNILNKCIDVRLFGATIPKKKGDQESKGESISIIGPVQFTWGYSLHPVEIVDSATITSMFKGRETEAEAGTIGKDWRLYYSLIAFYGVISGSRASNSKLKEDDIKVLDNLLWDSVLVDSTTRSKIGHMPHLYIRIEYKNDSDNKPTYLQGDLRRYIEASYDNARPIREFKDLTLKLDKLIDSLRENNNIESIYIRTSDILNESLNLNEKLHGINNIIHLPHNLRYTDIFKQQ